jgi:hypothetical protein
MRLTDLNKSMAPIYHIYVNDGCLSYTQSCSRSSIVSEKILARWNFLAFSNFDFIAAMIGVPRPLNIVLSKEA